MTKADIALYRAALDVETGTLTPAKYAMMERAHRNASLDVLSMTYKDIVQLVDAIIEATPHDMPVTRSQISGGTAIDIASKLAEPYGITVYQKGQPLGLKPIPQFNLNYGETAQEIIDRVCTYDGLLFYEDEYGNLVLSLVGTDTASSGIVYGQNVQEWSVTNSMDQRFSDYVCSSLSIDTLEDLGGTSLLYFTAKDGNVPRHRTMYLVAESVSGSWALCQIRALWEAARRAGRGTAATSTVDSWRDTGGTLWTPNTLVPVTLPGLRLPAATQLCISEVTYRYDIEGGKRAEISVLPQAAFQPQPIVIQPTPFATGEVVDAPPS